MKNSCIRYKKTIFVGLLVVCKLTYAASFSGQANIYPYEVIIDKSFVKDIGQSYLESIKIGYKTSSTLNTLETMWKFNGAISDNEATNYVAYHLEDQYYLSSYGSISPQKTGDKFNGEYNSIPGISGHLNRTQYRQTSQTTWSLPYYDSYYNIGDLFFPVVIIKAPTEFHGNNILYYKYKCIVGYPNDHSNPVLNRQAKYNHPAFSLAMDATTNTTLETWGIRERDLAMVFFSNQKLQLSSFDSIGLYGSIKDLPSVGQVRFFPLIYPAHLQRVAEDINKGLETAYNLNSEHDFNNSNDRNIDYPSYRINLYGVTPDEYTAEIKKQKWSLCDI